MQFYVNSYIELIQVRHADSDPYNQPGWKGTIIHIHSVTEEEEQASGYQLLMGETIYTVNWDNGYTSKVSPENGDKIRACIRN